MIGHRVEKFKPFIFSFYARKVFKNVAFNPLSVVKLFDIRDEIL